MIDCIEYSRLFDDGVHPQRWAEVGKVGMVCSDLTRHLAASGRFHDCRAISQWCLGMSIPFGALRPRIHPQLGWTFFWRF